MRIRISAYEGPLTVRFEPSGMEYELSSGDHLDVLFPPAPDDQVAGHVEYVPGTVTVFASSDVPGFTRAWNANGEEVTT
ncbi:hypothetical protein ABZ372_02670 [Streptomyces sp. NPDC005921]|uniref:hypothetical protein n=1 Tax=Streptomyces sp. NPDC005827 TaxID=3157070 RepID=UPI0033E74483